MASIIIYLPILIIALGYTAVAYVLGALGIMAIARRRGLDKPWLAWIPVADMWLIGGLADQADEIRSGRSTDLRLKLLVLTIVTLVVSMLSAVPGVQVMFAIFFVVIRIITAVFEYIAYYKILSSCAPESAVLLLVLSIVFSVITPFVIFALRKRDDGLYRWTNERGEAPQQ